MYFCPKCNFLLDITKKVPGQNINEISSVDEFIQKSLNNDLDNIVKIKFSSNDLSKSNTYKKLSIEEQELVNNKYDIYTKDNIVNAYFYCDNCNYNTKLEAGTIIFKTSTTENAEEDNSVLLSRVLDKTLPRTKDFICPNTKCDTNKKLNSKDREAVFYRPNSNSYNLKYVCCTCKTSWNPYFKSASK
jgi:acetone carboxylase gamma subunit